jgi:hypothetical protein
MNIREMHFDFLLKLDKISTQYREGFNPADIDWLLNEAQRVFINRRYSINNNHKRGFEATQKRIDDLSAIHIKYPVQPEMSLTEHSGVYELPLSELEYNYLHMTRGEVQVIEEYCDPSWAVIKLVQSDDLSHALKNPYTSSSKEEILANFGKSSDITEVGVSLYLYPSGYYSLGNIKLEYLREPLRMSLGGYINLDGDLESPQNCELSNITHPEIVDIAVDIAAGITENQNYAALTAKKLFNQE